MASTSTAETTEIKRRGRQRLVGAVAIVFLAVVFVPMVLDPEPRKERQEPSLAIPPRDNAPPLLAEKAAPAKPVEAAPAAPVPAPSPAEPKADPVKAPEPATPAVVPAKAAVTSVKTAKPPKVAAAPVEPPKAAPKAEPALPKLEGFAVQVGAFAEEERLRSAREKLTQAKVAHYIERLPTGLTRLRAGPFPTREAAERALPTVKAAGFDGQVVPLP